ncbi:hypothetical protein Tco_1426465 [Tanacetum coccineum]
MNDARSIEQLAQDNARGEDNNESASGEDEEGEQHSSDGDYSSKRINASKSSTFDMKTKLTSNASPSSSVFIRKSRSSTISE